MAWSRDRVDSSNINNGNEYQKGDRVSRQQLNAMVNAGLYSQDFVEALTEAPIVENDATGGQPSVELVDNIKNGKTYKKFKFKNIKGADGVIGKDGKSAYEYAQDGGYTGTEQEFASELGDVASKTYVQENGGKIDIIKVNGAAQTITDKAVNIEVPSIDGLASETYVNQKVADLVNSAPETLDTLGEVATAIQNNQNVVEALNEAIGNKANQSDLNTLNVRVLNVETKNSDQDATINNKANQSDLDITNNNLNTLTTRVSNIETKNTEKITVTIIFFNLSFITSTS